MQSFYIAPAKLRARAAFIKNGGGGVTSDKIDADIVRKANTTSHCWSIYTDIRAIDRTISFHRDSDLVTVHLLRLICDTILK